MRTLAFSTIRGTLKKIFSNKKRSEVTCLGSIDTATECAEVRSWKYTSWTEGRVIRKDVPIFLSRIFHPFNVFKYKIFIQPPVQTWRTLCRHIYRRFKIEQERQKMIVVISSQGPKNDMMLLAGAVVPCCTLYPIEFVGWNNNRPIIKAPATRRYKQATSKDPHSATRSPISDQQRHWRSYSRDWADGFRDSITSLCRIMKDNRKKAMGEFSLKSGLYTVMEVYADCLRNARNAEF